jgi:large subunit ribosomal protein L21
MLAIIKTGGKQYLVSPGDKIKIEKINEPSFVSTSAKAPAFAKVSGETRGDSPKASAPSVGKKAAAGKESQEIIFDEVLLLQKGNKLKIGTPFVKGAKVVGKVLRQGKGKKVIVFKYKPKTRYRVKKGHRQPFTEVEILKIED